MTTKSIDVVIPMLAERLDVDAATITADTELETLGADSLTVIELIFDLEDKFGVKLGDERPELKKVSDIADTIDRLVSQKAG